MSDFKEVQGQERGSIFKVYHNNLNKTKDWALVHNAALANKKIKLWRAFEQ